jgi:hypothetical protein
MFGTCRRVARRTARRTSRRQMAMMQGSQGGGQQEEYVDEPEPQYAPPPAAPAAPAQPSYVQELETLNQLKMQGILTQEEYDAKKKQILGL